MTKHHIFLIGDRDDEMAVFTESEANGECHLMCEYSGKVITAEASDYFEALSKVRIELEREGLIPFCYGASLNVFPSAMARQMGHGKTAYKIKMGKPALSKDLVRIFEQGADVIPSPVKRQKEYFNDWLDSLRG